MRTGTVALSLDSDETESVYTTPMQNPPIVLSSLSSKSPIILSSMLADRPTVSRFLSSESEVVFVRESDETDSVYVTPMQDFPIALSSESEDVFTTPSASHPPHTQLQDHDDEKQSNGGLELNQMFTSLEELDNTVLQYAIVGYFIGVLTIDDD